MVLPGFLRTAAASHTGLRQHTDSDLLPYTGSGPHTDFHQHTDPDPHTAGPAARIPADPVPDPQAGTGYHTGLRTLLQQPLISPHIYHDSLQDPPGNH